MASKLAAAAICSAVSGGASGTAGVGGAEGIGAAGALSGVAVAAGVSFLSFFGLGAAIAVVRIARHKKAASAVRRGASAVANRT